MAHSLTLIRRPLLVLAGLLLTAGCAPEPAEQSHEFTRLAFGTVVTIELITPDEKLAGAAMQALDELFAELDRNWYAFGEGELARVNAALGGGEPVETTAELSGLISRSLEYRQLSAGLFEPVIGELVELWGFADFNTRTTDPLAPSAAALDAWRSVPATARQVTVTGNTIRAAVPVRLDLGGIAKGAILARAAALLTGMGLTDALLDLGGDIRVLGERGARPWRIAIRDPFRDGVIGAIALHPGETIVTSGNYARVYAAGTEQIHHVLDPTTGRPTTGTAGVTVLHTDSERADAAATALMVAGPQRFAETAARMGIDTALLIDTAAKRHMTPAMQRRFAPGSAAGQ